MMLEDYIEQHARRHPDKVAIVCDSGQCSWRELADRVDRRVRQLNCEGEAGDVVGLPAEPTIDFLVHYFAIHRSGRIAVPLPKDRYDATHSEWEDIKVEDSTAAVADVLYTTGTTGRKKGVVISHRAILANAENLVDGQGFTPEVVFVINGPLNHIGSLSKVWPVVLVGGTLILVDGLRDINRFYQAFDYPSPKMATFLVPASIRILLQLSADRLASYAHKIDFIETGAAAISQTDMQALCRLLPHSRLYNTYASTETGIVCTYNYNDGDCLVGCLGRPMRHARVFITPEGLIACQGPQLMSGYAGDPEYTAQVLRDDTIYTHDLGQLDAEGRLHLTGRQDDVINVGGFKVDPVEIERVAQTHPSVADCLCTAVAHPITGQALQLLVVTLPGVKMDKRALALYLRNSLESFKVPQLYQQVDAIRRTFNGKPDRKYYRSR